MNSVNGLQTALRLYQSDKIKERGQGLEQLREIFSNRENINTYQDIAQRDGGAGWVALFQCLFQVVVMEKRLATKAGARAQADKRLADSISLVRSMAERTVHLISRKPFLALVDHMTHLLVFSSQIFPPTALDYAKALRCLLSYPPHLENLDHLRWKTLMGICWASVLGDEVTVNEDWEDGEEEDPEEGEKMDIDEFANTQAGPSRRTAGRATISQINNELISLIPILLSSSSAPLLPPLPSKEVEPISPPERVGHSLLLKVNRFFQQYPNETSAHLPILRSLNLLLVELELNCRDDFLSAGLKLLPHLVALWGTRNKALREQVVIAVRTIFPFVTHKTLVNSKEVIGVVETLEKLMDHLPRETTTKWGIEPLDLNLVRLTSEKLDTREAPFALRGLSAGFEFSHEAAMSWAVIELYRDTCLYLYTSQSLSNGLTSTPSREGPSAKRRRITNALTALISSTEIGPPRTRLLALHILIFFVDRHFTQIHLEAQKDIRRTMIELLSDDDESLQSWAFIGLSILALISHEQIAVNDDSPTSLLDSPSSTSAIRALEQSDWSKVWTYALRKASIANTCRTACHAAGALLLCAKIDSAQSIKDIHALLQNVDIQGPVFPYDSVCTFLSLTLDMARSDVRLYSLELENKVLAWFEKCDLLEGPRGTGRLEQTTPADVLKLFNSMARSRHLALSSITTEEILPDAAIIDRMLEEARTKPIRDFLLYGSFPSSPTTGYSTNGSAEAVSSAVPTSSDSLAYLEGRPRRVSAYLNASLMNQTTSMEALIDSAIPSERIRRNIDLIVLTLSFQASLQLNGYMPAADCIYSAVRLLGLVTPSLASTGQAIPSRHLIWQALEPLVYSPIGVEDGWPILIKPDVQSGIRQDLLATFKYDSATMHEQAIVHDASNGPSRMQSNGATFPTTQSMMVPSQIPSSGLSNFPPTPSPSMTRPLLQAAPRSLSNTIWQLTTVSVAFKEIFELCRKSVEASDSASHTNGSHVMPNMLDDDDFGEIRTVETDLMPLSKEAMECHRTSASLLRIQIGFRLKGLMLVSNIKRPYKDPQLVNCLLQADGSRFIEIGKALCFAVRNKWLRLGADAVDLIMESLEEMLRSYAYSRDENLLGLGLEVAQCSMDVWMAATESVVELRDIALNLVAYVATRIDKGIIGSWKVRMKILCFLDEFVYYESAKALWQQAVASVSDSEETEQDIDPLFYLSESLLDIDARVRVRAATSASTIFYRPLLPPEHHQDFYFSALFKQPGDDKHFDSFITHLLWKLNCCVATSQQRSAVVFHLYEIPSTSPNYTSHLQSGLEVVAQRLGLSSISSLYLPYAPVIIRSQLQEGQIVMRISPRLYGFTTRKAFSIACLARVGPSILASRQIDFFTSACEAATVNVSEAANQAFAATAAIVFAQAFGDKSRSNAEAAREVVEILGNIPGVDTEVRVDALLQSEIDGVVAHLWELLDFSASTDDIVALLDNVDRTQSSGKAYSELLTNDTDLVGTANAIQPSDSAANVIAAYRYISKQYPSLSPSKMVFNAILRLTSKINEAFLVSEQKRHLRALALVIVLHQEEFRQMIILQTYLREMLALLPQPDICGIVLSMVAWGFNQLEGLSESIPDLIDLFIELGSARMSLDGQGEKSREVGGGLEDWIINSSTIWNGSNITRTAFEAALALWPDELRQKLSGSYTPLFADLVTLSESSTVRNAGELSKQLLKIMKTGSQSGGLETFVRSLFWHLKDKLSSPGLFNQDGINAFLEILYMANGKVHAPSLEVMSNFSSSGNDQSRHQVPAAKIAKDPEGALRAAIVSQIARLTSDGDHETRSNAYTVLQGMLPMIADLMRGNALPPAVVAQLSVLTPIRILAATNENEPPALEGRITHPSFVKNAKSVFHWAKELVEILCSVVSSDDTFYRSLGPLFSSSTISLRPFLPHLIQAALTCKASQHLEITMDRSKAISNHFTVVVQSPGTSLETIHSILDIVLHLRHFQPLYRNGELGYNGWLEVDYVVLSDAAVKCGAYASALLFLEMARDQERAQPVVLSDSNVQNIMYEIYSNVEDPDGFYGIQNHDVRDALLRRLEHEGHSWRAFGWNGASIETSTKSSKALLPALHNLHSFGFNRLASSIAATNSRKSQEQEDDPFFFELAWRTGDWDLPISERSPSAKTPQGTLYSALRAVHRERDSEAALRVVNRSIQTETERLGSLGMERMAQIKRTAGNLLCLREAARWLNPEFQASMETPLGTTMNQFGDLHSSFEFSAAERLTATRLSLLQSAAQRESKNMFGDLLTPKMELIQGLEKSVHLQLGEMAREENNLQAAVNAITAVQQLESGRAVSDEAQDSFSHVLWAQREHGLAIQHVADLVLEVRVRKPANPGRLAVLLGRMGHWTSLAKLKAASEIKFTFDEAWSIIAKHKTIASSDQARIYYEYARFADSHYSSLSKSPELERLKAYHTRKAQELNLIESTLKTNRRESSSRSSRAVQEVEEDARAIEKLENERLTYIKVALKMYGYALTLSDAHDDSITQLCSLWLQHDENEDVNVSFAGALSRIPSHKFIFLGPQLAARLYRPTKPSNFNSNLNGLMLRMSQQHPFHILYQVITLAHGVHPPTSAKRKSTTAENEGRGPAALEILSTLSSDPNFPVAQKASKEMKVFVDASVSWARFEERSGSSQNSSKPKAGSTHNLPTNCPFKNLKLDIPIATSPPPVDLTLQYRNIPTFVRYRTQFSYAGGVHRPKIMKCYDSTAKQHQQLFKADDEVRQDAVMEQVFTITNDLLSRDRQAKARDLQFRTYNVVPFPERTGIIEFVEGTKGIGEWLKPAHLRYRSGIDIAPVEFQGKISKIQDRDPNSAELVKQYSTMIKRFQPVMRHFFVEKHKDPMAWFAMRLNYARSVAVTSIVGWMVGLGDRHCSNILIDQTSGELVHIDFGIVFEDGRKLRIPEKVPFRLTNDIVDGLGITGIEGTFRRCSEHTLRVLRDASSLVLTVLEVFKHDPLYAWAGDPDKLQRAQGGGRVDLITHDANVQEKADRVLGRIRDKLGGELSVEYTVNMLIQEARDVESLAKIYHGWASWF
ncbi:hypothetical protein I316_02654 [Kwoniella heveanensis BCC8398]|uniref:Serine/threonine-protein kinase Tel1 n=1 Tax=Kwoniella heveanensis BCC8398 TaxID=1296120 RepID=A0A1B9GX64_9TREE|nr:hypothetical protein I316_02654 [Kwoniella heveanensis BCC8398]